MAKTKVVYLYDSGSGREELCFICAVKTIMSNEMLDQTNKRVKLESVGNYMYTSCVRCREFIDDEIEI